MGAFHQPYNQSGRLIKSAQMQGACSLRSEAYRKVRRSDESKGNAADGCFSSAVQQIGGVAERFKAAVLKTAVPKGTVSSNLTSSARKRPVLPVK